jgi:OmpA-OmpF porin, OOP family
MKPSVKIWGTLIVLRNKIILIFSFLFILLSVKATIASTGNPNEKEANELKAKAIHYDRMGDVNNAIEFYSRYLSFKTKDIKLSYRLANLYFDTRNYAKANQYYDSVIKINKFKYILAYYRKGLVCMNLERYDKAKESFTKFRSYYRSKKDRNFYRRLAAVYIANADWARDNKNFDGNIIIEHLGDKLNNPDIDFAPFPVDDNNILYGSVYNESSGVSGPVRQIFKAQKVDGKWKSSGLLGGEVNDPEFNTGNAVLSADGKSLFFTRTRKNWQNKYVSEIFESHLEGDQWLKPEKLPPPVNIENYSSTQPALGKSMKTGNHILYFVSDRPGGKGGKDIWVTEYDNKKGIYKKPVDLLNKVNSSGDECCPFYDISTQTLYFSSKGRKNGLGGFDIYKSTGSTRLWSDAVPLPKPVNSSFDDYYFSIQKNNKEGFFSSNRPGTMAMDNGSCCDDIFSFKTTECISIHSWGTVRNSVNYDFYDALNARYHLGLKYPENNSTISDVPVELYLSQEKEKDEILISKTSTDKNGNYTFELVRDKQYKVLVKNYGYFEKNVPVNTFNKYCSDTINIGTTLINYLPKVTIQVNIYYEFDKYRLTESAKKTIDTMVMPLFDLFPTGIIEIGSHTDNRGMDQYNINLSQNRSESVVSYIISKGISPERLVAKGYGMRVPIAPNTNRDGTDNPEGRQLNRRTEFKIVGQLTTTNDL